MSKTVNMKWMNIDDDDTQFNIQQYKLNEKSDNQGLLKLEILNYKSTFVNERHNYSQQFKNNQQASFIRVAQLINQKQTHKISSRSETTVEDNHNNRQKNINFVSFGKIIGFTIFFIIIMILFAMQIQQNNKKQAKGQYFHKLNKDSRPQLNKQLDKQRLIINGNQFQTNINQKSQNKVEKLPSNNNQKILYQNKNKEGQFQQKNQKIFDQKSAALNQQKHITCIDYIIKTQEEKGKLYQFAVKHEQFKRNSNAKLFVYQNLTNITQTKYSQAIDLMKLIHNVDSNGNLNAKDTPCQKGSEIKSMLQSTMKSQTQRLNSEYQIDKYHSKQLRFCIVVNSYRNAQNGLLYRNIDSILQQDYTNYHVVYTDDHSPDRTGEVVVDYLKQKQVPEGKFKVKINAKKVGMMENIYNAITNDCELGEIAVMLDGDDSFIGRNVLSLLNAVYQKQKVALIWSNFLKVLLNSMSTMGFSKPLSSKGQLYESRIKSQLFSSHLKSFYVDLFKKVPIQEFQEAPGKIFGGASDTATMIPMLQLAYPRIKYISEILYEYRYDTGQVGNDVNKYSQSIAAGIIGSIFPHKSLSEFQFIDKAIENTQHQV